jgi:hypothetical protein
LVGNPRREESRIERVKPIEELGRRCGEGPPPGNKARRGFERSVVSLGVILREIAELADRGNPSEISAARAIGKMAGFKGSVFAAAQGEFAEGKAGSPGEETVEFVGETHER